MSSLPGIPLHQRSLTSIEEGLGPAEMCELTVKQQQSKGQTRPIPIFTWAIVALIIVFGLVACACFIVFGVTAANNDQRQQFQRVADEFISHIEAAFEEYRAAGLWIHQACHNRNISRVEYGELYEHLTSHGLDVLGANMVFNITDDEREAMEQEARQFYGEFYPELEYNGIVGLEPDNSSDTGYSVQPRSQQPFYYAVHLIAPVLENFKAADFDLYSSATRRETIYSALNTWEPALTERLVLVQETEGTYSVVLMHPGIPLSSRPEAVPRDLSNIVIRIPDLLNRATDSQTDPVSIYLYDSASSDTDEFLGGLSIEADANATRRFMAEIEIGALRASQAQGHQQERVVQVADKKWTVVVLSAQGTYEPKLTFILLGGIITLVGSVCVALWVLTNTWRVSKISQMKAMADQEKAALIVENAKNATRLERELNDWISHEVRNPVSAAMSACTFVKNSLKQDKPLKDAKVLQSAREDVQIIDNSLQFINDLLRNMLDMHRASSNQLKVAMKPTDIKQDVFEPVDSMLYRRGCTFDVIIDCPDDLIVMTDRLRLKQVILNLARNSTKFLSSGFIRLKATVENDRVVLYVEDSGTGIPKEKRPILFAKFQESLDNLNQGTGIGLSLCKNLTELMEGKLWLDECYDSGIPGFPGTCFVIDLDISPLQYEPEPVDSVYYAGTEQATIQTSDADCALRRELPETLSVLFVDDDLVLRKLFTRSIKRVLPNWKVREVSNGETALKVCENESFDLIFMDQYMASVEKQLLGTEAVHALRMQGFGNKICGLSANNVEEPFFNAGADAFMFKPFPCEEAALVRELHRILHQKPCG